jgi:uroporphyrinogen decarboxylase
MLKDSLFLQALQGKNRGRPPVWLMRQAGRYLSSYRKIRTCYSLSELFHHEELIQEITMLPINELGVDAAILFSDILIPLEALGFSVAYEQGPVVFPKTCVVPCIATASLKEQFGFLFRAVQGLKKNLTVPLIGFSGAPFTMASYILEQDAHHLLKKTKTALYTQPEAFFSLLDQLAELVIAYLKMQIEAGVDALQIFDSWAGHLDTESFRRCSVYYLDKILNALKATKIPVIIFCRGSSLFVEELVDLHPSALSFDWHKPLSDLKKRVPYPIALQGNLDPDVLRAPFAVIQAKTKKMLASMEGETRFIVNLGHGVAPDIKEEAVKCFVDTVQSVDRLLS